MRAIFTIPAYIAALAISSRHPLERECLLAWANAALAYFLAGGGS
jgi:hypothetical protein